GSHKKRRKVFRLAKGYFGAKSKQYKTAKQAVMKSLKYAYTGRKLKKRDMRKLWIIRINAEARNNGISYSMMMNGLRKSGIDLNRKILADMAVNDKVAFAKLAETAKKKVQA
ncbi:MAG: 50S ribosomal protein L20, partial [Christensenellaceae bacterium]